MKNIFLMALIFMTGQIAFATAETFKLYDEPNKVVDPACDLYTELVVDFSQKVTTATLATKLSGTCEIAVPQEIRTFSGEVDKEECGRLTFYSDIRGFADGAGILVVDDNRNSTCEYKSKIEATEIQKTFKTERVYYSKDN